MPWYKRLRWQLIGSQFLVAAVGVSMMLLATQVIILGPAPNIIEAKLHHLLANPTQTKQTVAHILQDFRYTIFVSVGFSAIVAILAGIWSSVLIWRNIIAPMRSIATRSQRITDGRYGERVEVPTNGGEAMAQLVMNFNHMTENLEEIEAQRITLLGNIAHELRTPLTSLNGSIEGLVDGLFSPTEETFLWMSDEVKRLSRLVDDIQNLSRIEAGQFSLHLQPIVLNEQVGRVVAQLNPQALAKGIEIEVVYEETAVIAQGDSDRIAQILINLIGNAIRYTPENGTIAIQVGKQVTYAHVAVKDSGVGIPPEALPYLFERFYRVDQSRARATGGSGIGLTISRHLAWAMGGEITVQSEGENQGSTFTLTLPLNNQ